LAFPTAAAVGSSGNLCVADTGNSRVLMFLNPLCLGQADGFLASPVIGQNGSFTAGQDGDFTSAGCPTTPSASTLCVPNGLALDASGNLYAVDAGYDWVLEFSTSSSSPTLVKVLGQPDATALNSCSSADPTAICATDGGVAVDASGKLYVDGGGAGTGIGIYNPPATESSPDVILPARAFGIALTSSGSMFISQGNAFAAGSSTPVEYPPPFTNESVPSEVFGPSFILPQILPLTFSYGLGLDSRQFLYLADSGSTRVLIFQHVVASATPTASASPKPTKTPTPTPTATGSTPTATPTPDDAKLKISHKSGVKFGKSTAVDTVSKPKQVTIKNDISKKSAITVSITSESTAAPFAVSIECVTSLAPGKSCKVLVTFSPTNTTEQSRELTINDDKTGALQMIPLSGTGKAPKTKK
jgi:hypothetical protein